MIEKISLRIFLGCAFVCGSLIITMIWWQPEKTIFEHIIPTLFIIGFFAFLVWATHIVYRFLIVLSRDR